MKKYKPEITVDREVSTEPEDIFFAGNIVEYAPEKAKSAFSIPTSGRIVMVSEHRFSREPIHSKFFKGIIIEEIKHSYSIQGEYSESFRKDCFKQFHGTITIKV